MKVGNKWLLRKFIYLIPISVLFVMPITINAKGYTFPEQIGNSPIQFTSIDFPSDSYVVNDTGPKLDTYMYRGNGNGDGFDITIPINIHRYVGDIDKLLETGLISPTFRIFIPAYDVDSESSVSFDCDNDGIIDSLYPEQNLVSFNGVVLGSLKGSNNTWQFNKQFELDIKKLNFPQNPGDIGYNTIGIKIDAANKDIYMSSGQKGCKVWATEIDWASVKFEVTSPVVLVPGLFGSPNSLEKFEYGNRIMYHTGLPSKVISHTSFVPSMSACSSSVIPSLNKHAMEMRNSIKEFAETYGTDAVHLISHSKGGLDSRVFLETLKDNPLFVKVGSMSGYPVKVHLSAESLVTHGTPHKGSVLADKLLAHGLDSLAPIISDVCDLTTRVMRTVNGKLGEPPKEVTTLLIAGDADQNSDGQISVNEALYNTVEFSNISTLFYEWLRDIAEVYIEYSHTDGAGHIKFERRIIEILTNFPQLNDTAVTINSALASVTSFNHTSPAPWASDSKKFVGMGYGKNHGSILFMDVQLFVIYNGLNGALNWRLR